MDNRLIHTPEGVRDIYGAELLKKQSAISKIKDVINSYGYMSIQTPSFEFFDVFSKEIGTSPSKELYKFFDKENNTLVLRADFTPSIARASAKYFVDEKLPVRLTYEGNVFRNISDLQGKLKETTQVGAECIGEATVNADAELIALNVNCLLAAGLKDFQISVGQVDYFKGICEAAGLSEETELRIRDQISGKNVFALLDVLEESGLSENVKEKMRAVSELYGDAKILDKAYEIADNERSRAAIERLRALYELLTVYGIEKYVSFDLGILTKYHYYTGIVFRAYTYGVGEPVSAGGRYDSLIEKFGKNSAAVGFVISVDQLMLALKNRQLEPSNDKSIAILVYEEDCAKKAVSFAIDMRKKGLAIELIPSMGLENFEEYVGFSKGALVDEIYYANDGKVVKKR